MQRFGGSFGQAIRQRLQQDVVVVVVRRLEALEMRLDADAGRDRERADVVHLAGILGRDEIRQRVVRLARGLGLLLAQVMQAMQHARARGVAVHLDFFIDRVAREEPDHRARLSQCSRRMVASISCASLYKERADSPRTGSWSTSGNLPPYSQALKNGIQSMYGVSDASGTSLNTFAPRNRGTGGV